MVFPNYLEPSLINDGRGEFVSMDFVAQDLLSSLHMAYLNALQTQIPLSGEECCI